MGSANQQEQDTVAAYLRKSLELVEPKKIARFRPYEGEQVRRVFDKLRANPPPMLVICGIYDRVILPRDQHTVAEVTKAMFVEVDCGHFPTLIRPDACARHFMSFVNALKPQQASP